MKKILLTGGTGFLGEEILKEFKNRYLIFSIFRKKKGIESKNIKWIKLNLKNELDFEKNFDLLKKENIDYVIHAGGSTPNRAYEEGNYDATTMGTRFLVELSKKLNIKKIIFISSISVTYKKKGPYASSKLIAEDIIKKSGLNYTILRPETIIGENAKDFRRLANILKEKKFFVIIGAGNNLNQPIYVKDLVNIIHLCIENHKTDHKTYSVFGQDCMTTKDFLKKIAELQGNKITLIAIPKFIVYPFSILLGVVAPRLGINPERVYIMSYSKGYLKSTEDLKIKTINIEKMLSFLKKD
ncbi:MAG: NAD(P)-dependent oxidoreductase [Candidatus Nanoarchaeia archaeon]|nr:NAD(P)-dependent oxidoreductase [Candidatus Nanoarchaeia archaeon]